VSAGLVHDHLLVMRGAERTFAAIAGLWPEAPIYTLVYDEETTDGRFAGRDVHSSMLQGQRVRQRGYRRMQRLFAWAVRRLPVEQHDVVISSSTGFALGVRPNRDAAHVCYVHSLFREAWDLDGAGPFARLGFSALRRADRSAAAHVTDFVANSALTQRRLEEAFGRESTVIHPPVEVQRFAPREPEDYFLVIGELVPHKRIDVALEAARLADVKLKVVGSGLGYRKLFARYGETTEFMRRLEDPEMATLLAGARALIVPNVEEFGIAAVEAQAAGRPVVGVQAGGLVETVVPGKTGVLVEEATPEAFAEVLRSVDFGAFDSAAIARHAQQFSQERFEREFRRHVDRVVGRHAAEAAQASRRPAARTSTGPTWFPTNRST
jgi:glycosyltransferase involved in cell wall biosynthesis